MYLEYCSVYTMTFISVALRFFREPQIFVHVIILKILQCTQNLGKVERKDTGGFDK